MAGAVTRMGWASGKTTNAQRKADRQAAGEHGCVPVLSDDDHHCGMGQRHRGCKDVASQITARLAGSR